MWRRKPPELDLRPDDRALVLRLRAGEESAFEEFFDRHFHGLYRFALTRLDSDTGLAKEVAQAAICKAIEKLHTYRGEAPLFSWLCSICRFEISAHFRRQRRERIQPVLPEEATLARGVLDSIPSDLDGPESELLRNETARLVHLTVDHLPTHYGKVLEWKYNDGLSVNEIATQLRITPKAAESLLSRARGAFRDAFGSLAAGLRPRALKGAEES